MIFFTVFGICLVAIAVALNVSWIVLNWRMGVLAILGVILFGLIIAGMVLNTIFLVREIRRNEQKDSFLNAVTHELKTPVASIRLYLQTLQTRELDAEKRKEFYRIMLEDSDRLLHTIEQVLRAGSARSRFRREARHTACLCHPNIVTLFEFGYNTEYGLYFLALEFVDGINLFDYIVHCGRLQPKETRRILLQLGDDRDRVPVLRREVLRARRTRPR